MSFLDDIPDLNLPKSPGDLTQRQKRTCVSWNRPRCPYCNSPHVPVTNSNHIPYRYHKCSDCGRNFTSLETNFCPDGT